MRRKLIIAVAAFSSAIVGPAAAAPLTPAVYDCQGRIITSQYSEPGLWRLAEKPGELAWQPQVDTRAGSADIAAMATREARLSEFNAGPAPADHPLQVLCEDHNGTYLLPYHCRWRDDAWYSCASNAIIDATVVGWRAPPPARTRTRP